MANDGTNFGPLESLVGTWMGNGNGWNIIAVPTTPTDAKEPVAPGNSKNAILGSGYQLEIQNINEDIVISPTDTSSLALNTSGSAPNKGGEGGAQTAFGLEYRLSASEVGGPGLHFETGIWLNLQDGPNVTPPNTHPIVRLAAIPHGNSVLLMGDHFSDKGAPTIGNLSPLPTGPGVDAKYLEAYTTMTTRFTDVFGPAPAFNANKPLVDDLAKQDVASTETFVLSTANSGGITNVPFGDKNAKAFSWEIIVWIETLSDGTLQMQYTQTIIIEFFGIKWPHIVINTLTKQ